MSESTSEPDFRLRIDAHALVQLGEQLITDDEQAILELVKNSYDADADWSIIRIQSDYIPDPEKDHVPAEAQGLIEIEDNGTGMDQTAIERGWLLISLSLKRAQKEQGTRTTKHKRLPLGDKGLGRLGTMKLGKCLSVETRNAPDSQGWLVTFQWSDIRSGTLLENVPIKWIRIPANGKTGTTVRIYGLREIQNWRTGKRKKRLELKLSGLISPFDMATGFDVTLTFNNQPIDLARINAQLRETANVSFSYDWDNTRLLITGRLKLIWFRKKLAGYEQFIAPDGGKALFGKLASIKDLQTRFHPSLAPDPSWFLEVSTELAASDVQLEVNDASNPGRFSGSLDYFDLDTDIEVSKALFNNEKDYRELVKQLAQIYVYRDGFGIRMPNDWLKLGAAWTSQAGFYSLKPSNVIGYFKLSVNDNDQLVEKSDREGFTDNSAWRGFSLLTDKIAHEINTILNKCGKGSAKFLNESAGTHATEEQSTVNYGRLVDRLEKLVSTSESLKGYFKEHAQSRLFGLRKIEGQARLTFLNSKDPDDKRSKAKELLDTVERIHSELESDHSKILLVTEELSEQRELAAIIRRRVDDFDERSQLLYDMVGVGLSAQALAHDVPAMLQQLNDEANALGKISKIKPLDIGKIIAMTDTLKGSIHAVEQMIDFVRPMLRGRRLSRRRASVSEFIQNFFDLRGARLRTRGITWFVEGEDRKDFEIALNPGRFTQTLDNLTTNSEYWIEHHFGSDSKKGRITLEIRDPELIFYDNGQGIRPDLEESLFEIFTTGKDGAQGNGLGLFITRQLLLRDNCTISLDPRRNAHGRLYRFVINFSGVKK